MPSAYEDWILNFQPIPIPGRPAAAPAPEDLLPDLRTNMERDYPLGYKPKTAEELQWTNPNYTMEGPGDEAGRLSGEYASARADQISPPIGGSIPYLAPFMRGIVGAARTTQQTLAMPLNLVPGLGDVSGAVLDEQRAYDTAYQRSRQAPESTGEEFVRNLSQGVAEIAGLGKVLKAFGLGAKAYMTAIGTRTYDTSLKQAKESGLDEPAAQQFAVVNAATEVGTESLGRMLGVGALAKLFPGGSAKSALGGTFAELMKTGGGEAVEEAVTQLVQNGNEMYHRMRPVTAEALLDGVGMASAVGFGVGTAVAAPSVYKSRGLRREVAEQRMADQQKLLDQNVQNVEAERRASRMAGATEEYSEVKKRAAEWLQTADPEVIDRIAQLGNGPSRRIFSEAAGIDRGKTPGNSALRQQIVWAAREWQAKPRALPGWKGRNAVEESMLVRDVAQANDLDPHELADRVQHVVQEDETEWDMRRQVQDEITQHYGTLSPSERKQLAEGDEDSVGRLGRFDEFVTRFGPESGITPDMVRDVIANGIGPKPTIDRLRIEEAARGMQPRSETRGESEDATAPANQLTEVAPGVMFAPGKPQHDLETIYRSIPGSNLPELMRKLEPGADSGALVTFNELRKQSSLDKKSFDTIAMELARRGVLSLHAHDYVGSLTEAERADLVNGKYIGAAIRQKPQGGASYSPATQNANPAHVGGGLFPPPEQIDTQHPTEYSERVAPGKETSSVAQVVKAANALVKAISGRDVVSRLGRLPKATPGGQPVAGMSKTHAGVRRRKSYTALPVEFHEASHQLYKALRPALAADPNVKAIARELHKMGVNLYGDEEPAAGYAEEGFSEFQALVNTNIGLAKKHMPATLAWWDAYVKQKPGVAKPAGEARRLGHLWYAQGMLARADAQRVTPAQQRADKRKASLQRMVSPDHLRKLFTNAAHFTTTWAANEAERKLGRKLRPSESPDYIGAIGVGTSSGTTQHFILNGTINPDESLNGPETSLKAAVASMKTIDPKKLQSVFGRKLNAPELQRLFDFYRKAKRTIALQTSDNPRETGMSVDDAQWFIDKVDREFPQFAQAHEAVNRWWDAFMEYQTSKDPLYAKVYAEIRSKDPGEYSPMQRFFPESDGDTRQLAAAVRSRAQWGTIGGRLKGSGRPTKDILSQMAIQMDAITRQVAQRQALEALARLRDITPDFGNVMEKIPAGKIPQAHNVKSLLEQIEKELQKDNPDAEVGVSGMDPKELSQAILTLFTDQYRPGGRDPIYPRIDAAGQLEWNHVNPEVLLSSTLGS